MTGRKNCFWRGEEGAVAVEFALVLPLLLAILLGIVCFGQYFSIAHSLQQLAAESARHSVLELSEANRMAKAEEYILGASSRLPILQSGKVSHAISPATTAGPGIVVTISYNLSGSAIDLVDGFLGLDIPEVSRSSYLAY